MGISKKYLAENFVPVQFDPEALASILNVHLLEVEFCFIMGSAQNGIVNAYSDLDLAFYLNSKPTWSFYDKATDVVKKVIPDVRCDVGILNAAEPVYRFEALKGTLLFARNMETYAAFFSRTCREYESQLFDYERQRRYRREAIGAV